MCDVFLKKKIDKWLELKKQTLYVVQSNEIHVFKNIYKNPID